MVTEAMEFAGGKLLAYSECDRYSVILLGKSNCVLVVGFCLQTWYFGALRVSSL
jgi:hypothetical protein